MLIHGCLLRGMRVIKKTLQIIFFFLKLRTSYKSEEKVGVYVLINELYGIEFDLLHFLQRLAISNIPLL